MIGDGGEDVGEPRSLIDIVELCRLEQGVDHCGALSAAVFLR